jgi:hypothetical protein
VKHWGKHGFRYAFARGKVAYISILYIFMYMDCTVPMCATAFQDLVIACGTDAMHDLLAEAEHCVQYIKHSLQVLLINHSTVLLSYNTTTGCFVFNLVTLSTMLCRLVEVEHALRAGHSATRRARFKTALTFMISGTVAAVTPVPQLRAMWSLLCTALHRTGEAAGSSSSSSSSSSSASSSTGVRGLCASLWQGLLYHVRKHHRDVVHPLKVAAIMLIAALFVLSDTLRGELKFQTAAHAHDRTRMTGAFSTCITPDSALVTMQ